MIRPYTTSDQKEVLELLRLNTPTYFHPSEEEDLIKYLNHERECYFVLEHDNQIVGCGGFNLGFNNNKTARISWDMVHPDKHGYGIGSKLTNYRIECLKKHEGLEEIIVRTSQHAHLFYAKFGFKLDNKIDHFWSQGFHLYEMSMKIN